MSGLPGWHAGRVGLLVIVLVLASGFGRELRAETDLPEGGTNYQDAKELKAGIYRSTGDNLESGEKVYFTLPDLKPGQSRHVSGTLHSNIDSQNLRFSLQNGKRQEITSAASGQKLKVSWLPGKGETVQARYLVVEVGPGYPADKIDFTLTVSAKDWYDADSKQDAGNKITEALPLEPGTYQGYFAGRRSGSDYADFYRIELEKGQEFKARLTPPSDAGLGLSVYNEKREKVSSDTSANRGAIVETGYMSFEDEPVFLRVDAGNVRHELSRPTVKYELTISTELAPVELVELRSQYGLSRKQIRKLRNNLSPQQYQQALQQVKQAYGANESAASGSMNVGGDTSQTGNLSQGLRLPAPEAGKQATDAAMDMGRSIGAFLMYALKMVIYAVCGVAVIGVGLFLVVKGKSSKATTGEKAMKEQETAGPESSSAEQSLDEGASDEQETQAPESSTGLKANAAGALTYLLGFITGIAFIIIEKDSDFVKFHAAQSTVTFGGLFIITWIPFVGPLAGLLALVLWILLMVKSYQGKRFELPIAAELAEKLLANMAN